MAKTDLGQLSARVSLDSVDFSRNLAALKRELKVAKQDFDLAGKGIHGFGDDVSKGEAQLKHLERQMGLNNQALQRHSEEYKKASAAAAENGETTSKAMQKAQSDFNKARLEAANLMDQYKKIYIENARAESSFYKFNDVLVKTSEKMITTGQSISRFGDAWTKVSVAIGGATGLLLKQFIDWESSVASMEKTIDNSDGTVDRLAVSFRELSKEIPVSAAELNELAGVAGQLGIENDAIEGFTRVVADLGVTTNVSSEQAASSLAQLANVTNMNQAEFSNLGSSIVELGNNFATTEADIINMSHRLAGAGATIGMSEAEITGIATALSSLGIKAEQGGSSFSKLMINMNVASETGLQAMTELEQATGMTRRELELMSNLDGKGFKEVAGSLGMTTTEMMKIINASKDLEGFAEVAGMTAAEFQQAFEVDAVGAIAAFVDGLSSASEHGETAIGILDEMGISEIRLRDTLLRVGNAQGLFNDAVETSNRAWEENTALTDEANLRYETNASKIQMAKNEIQDMAIELGAELLPAIADLLQQGRPVVDMVTGWIDAFASSSDETKEFVATLLGISIVGGPVLSVFGRLLTAGGQIGKVVGTSGKALFDFHTEMKAGKAATEAASGAGELFAGSVAKGTGGIKLFGGAMKVSTAALTTALPVIAGVTAAVALGYGAWKLWGEGAVRSAERTKKWGTDIGEEADKALTEFQNLAGEAEIATMKMAYNIEDGAQGAIDAYSGMAESIKTDVKETISETEESLAGLPESVREIVGESLQAGIEEQTKLIEEIDVIQAKITGIYENALAENREVTDEELKIIENYHNRLAEIRSETLELSAEEQRKVQAVMAEDLKSFSAEQLRQRKEMLSEEKGLLEEQYNEQAEFLEEKWTAGLIGEKEYLDGMAALSRDHNENMTKIGAEYVKVWRETGEMTEQEMKSALEAMGFTSSEVFNYLNLTEAALKHTAGVVAETSENATTKVREANEAWNGMVLDEKTGEVKTNIQEVLREAAQSEEGWANLEFIMHNAELETNAMEMIKEALQANGMWWDIELPPKFAELQTNSMEEAVKFLQAHGVWDSLPFEMHNAILTSNTAEEVVEIVKEHEKWKNLPWDLRQALVSTNARETQGTFTTAHAEWEGRKWTPKNTNINVSSNASTVASRAQSAINNVRGKTVTITTNHVRKDVGAHPIRSAAGSNFHPGGPGILGDAGQHEPYLTPNGTFGISPKEDTLYNFPRGTKVWRNIESLLKDIPHYANGTVNEPIRVGDRVFRQLTDALVPFDAPNFTNRSENAAESSTGAMNIEGDTYHIHLTANGDLPQNTIDRMTDRIVKTIKRKETSRKMSKGGAVNAFR